MNNLPETKAVDLVLNDEWLTISFNQPEKRNALTESYIVYYYQVILNNQT